MPPILRCLPPILRASISNSSSVFAGVSPAIRRALAPSPSSSSPPSRRMAGGGATPNCCPKKKVSLPNPSGSRSAPKKSSLNSEGASASPGMVGCSGHVTPDWRLKKEASFPIPSGSRSAPEKSSLNSEGPSASYVADRNKSPDTVPRMTERAHPGKMPNRGVQHIESNLQKHRFDIYTKEHSGVIRLKPSLLEQNKEKRKLQGSLESGIQTQVLRPGMVLLKGYIKHKDQVKIVQKCREFGIGDGGFYRPGYNGGAKLNLQMLCLGKNWDPESRSYGNIRPIDNTVPPPIPDDFREMVLGAIKASRDFLKLSQHKEDEIPVMSPDICIMNFYSKTGKLGLHQDRDESRESLDKGLPVVSFSVGDTAVFLYGDVRDPDAAEEVKLDSGDVLIFGGKSRHVFHGVSSIVPETAPGCLVSETNLRTPGRLNLTFRQY